MNTNVVDVFEGMGVRIRLPHPDNFLKIKETLTRMGTLTQPNTLYQTCYILHKKRSYAIMHVHEMLQLDGEPTVMSQEDEAHRNTVAFLLDQWGLAELDDDLADQPRSKPGSVIVIPHKQKADYNLVPLYVIGRPK